MTAIPCEGDQCGFSGRLGDAPQGKSGSIQVPFDLSPHIACASGFLDDRGEFGRIQRVGSQPSQ
jgi:hypothetical protein